MADAAEALRVTYEEYLAFERESQERHEFVDGRIWAMTGGTWDHALLVGNVAFELRSRLQRGACRVVHQDARLRVEHADASFYPDVMVVCGTRETPQEDRDSTTNPTLVAEILSPSTEAYDRSVKLDACLQLPSLRHFLLVRQDRRRVESYRRDGDGDRWIFEAFGAGATLPLPALGCEIPVDALYEGAEEGTAETSTPPGTPVTP